ncbi:uncharacterized protein LOC119089913 [Pollicipes pollicipes]|uniref:uncharacterized protein LOC119089913 n=1 Tax=Pollicipes pollicipes TaxID=41117 RepID=UPI0018850CE6|nr:uncharacterized protein LOC119089913 [Pollicipes pollicipes]
MVAKLDQLSPEQLRGRPSQVFRGRSGYYCRFSDRVIDTVLESTAFVFPKLLPTSAPHLRPKNCVTPGREFTIFRELDQLIAMGLEQFTPYANAMRPADRRRVAPVAAACRYMARYMLPLTTAQLQARMRYVRNRNLSDNPIMVFLDRRRAPPVLRDTTLPEYPLTPLISRPRQLDEPWSSLVHRGNAFFKARGLRKGKLVWLKKNEELKKRMEAERRARMPPPPPEKKRNEPRPRVSRQQTQVWIEDARRVRCNLRRARPMKVAISGVGPVRADDRAQLLAGGGCDPHGTVDESGEWSGCEGRGGQDELTERGERSERGGQADWDEQDDCDQHHVRSEQDRQEKSNESDDSDGAFESAREPAAGPDILAMCIPEITGERPCRPRRAEVKVERLAAAADIDGRVIRTSALLATADADAPGPTERPATDSDAADRPGDGAVSEMAMARPPAARRTGVVAPTPDDSRLFKQPFTPHKLRRPPAAAAVITVCPVTTTVTGAATTAGSNAPLSDMMAPALLTPRRGSPDPLVFGFPTPACERSPSESGDLRTPPPPPGLLETPLVRNSPPVSPRTPSGVRTRSETGGPTTGRPSEPVPDATSAREEDGTPQAEEVSFRWR